MVMTLQERVRSTILDVPDFPTPGIVFKDITPVLEDASLFAALTAHWAEELRGEGLTHVVAVESRGFLFGAPLAVSLGLPLTLVRKPGKLPRPTRSMEYELEYGTDALHIHEETLGASDRVVVIDDVLATGGTAEATAKLVESCGAEVASLCFLMELGFLDGRRRLGTRSVSSVVLY